MSDNKAIGDGQTTPTSCADVTAIKAVTDVIPDSGAMTSIAQDATVAKEATLTGLHAVPAVNSADNTTTSKRLGNKTDSITLGVHAPDGTFSVFRLLDYIIKAFSFQFTPPTADDAGSTYMTQVIGTKSDTTAGTSIVSLLKKIFNITSTVDATGTFSYLDAGAKQEIFELTNTTRKIITGIYLDLRAMTKSGVATLEYKINGSYGVLDTIDYAYGVDAEILLISGPISITEDFKVSYTEDSDEGADRAIPYSIIYEVKE